MVFIHLYKVNKLAECNLLHDILNPPKLTQKLYIHYSPILQGCINIRTVKGVFKDFQILLDSGCFSTIIMRRRIKKLTPKKSM